MYFKEGHSAIIANGGIIKENHRGVSRKIEHENQIKKETINAIEIINLFESKILRVSPNKGSTIEIVKIIGKPIYDPL